MEELNEYVYFYIWLQHECDSVIRSLFYVMTCDNKHFYKICNCKNLWEYYSNFMLLYRLVKRLDLKKIQIMGKIDGSE